MNLLREQDSNAGDTELLVYGMTLVNKVLNAIPDIDTYFDQVDALEQQGIQQTIQRLVKYMISIRMYIYLGRSWSGCK